MESGRKIKTNIPLADRMRPQSLEDFLGQDEIVGDGKMLRRAIEDDSIPSMIFWGPPGTGKTTLAKIIAAKSGALFEQMSAVSSGKKDLLEICEQAKTNRTAGHSTILFIDEIHRWNKAQQDALLPFVESGLITLIGATTENPSFELRGALLSRCRTFILARLSEDALVAILKRAVSDKEQGLGGLGLEIGEDELGLLASLANGDARTALNVLEYASSHAQKIGVDEIRDAFQKSHLLYDRNGEEHYNIISALHKSLRGSDENAALYWLARMLEAGEEPLYIARRLVRFASEDVGLANSRALEQCVAAYQACHFIGMPECNVILAQAVIYLARCEKSNKLYTAYGEAAADVRKYGNLPVPLHIRNAPTKFMKDIGYGKGYKYSPDHNYEEEQEYLPEKLRGRRYFN